LLRLLEVDEGTVLSVELLQCAVLEDAAFVVDASQGRLERPNEQKQSQASKHREQGVVLNFLVRPPLKHI